MRSETRTPWDVGGCGGPRTLILSPLAPASGGTKMEKNRRGGRKEGVWALPWDAQRGVRAWEAHRAGESVLLRTVCYARVLWRRAGKKGRGAPHGREQMEPIVSSSAFSVCTSSRQGALGVAFLAGARPSPLCKAPQTQAPRLRAPPVCTRGPGLWGLTKATLGLPGAAHLALVRGLSQLASLSQECRLGITGAHSVQQP